MSTFYKQNLFLVVVLSAVIFIGGCKEVASPYPKASYRQDSLQVTALLTKGDSVYAKRSSMAGIAESMLYFDSANRIAQRLGDTLLLANTLYFIGNVYNAWNKEPQTTVSYYTRSSQLYTSLPQKKQKAFYVRYILAHAYDGEKAADTPRCKKTLSAALADLQAIPGLTNMMDTVIGKWNFISDYAWVATNVGDYKLAEAFLALVPRSKISNDPESNNYLDHYYLTRARLEVTNRSSSTGLYLDSLRLAINNCGNRFDSAYYCSMLSKLYEAVSKPAEALYFSRLSEQLNAQVGTNDILSVLRQELLHQQVITAKETEKRIKSDLARRNVFFIGMIVMILLLIVLWQLWLRRRKEVVRRQRQQAFTALLLQKEEDERRRIAFDLHDGINHELLSLKNNLLLQKPVVAQDVETIITSIREISRNLFPSMFESIGLAGSTEALCERSSLAGFFTTCDIDYEEGLTKKEELQVYRIIQESLNNVARHAGAEAAKLTLKNSNGVFFLEIKDNGKGFDTAKLLNSTKGFGVQSMQQRAVAIGALLTINSGPAGTVIQLTKTISN